MKPPEKPQRPKPQRPSGKPTARGNPQLTAQTRKMLGKHYANKYRVK